ncbi:MAG: OsmC family peroxiredoxin [Acidobacteria bacterium]|nr:MAG: OsmC family peroxiredoxin [Acidobacteriota bacterium]
MQRTANAQWKGGLKDGKGTISTASGTLSNTQYSFGTRFESGKGTNPEELIAAAHAGCFSMALSAELGKASITPESIETKCTVTFEKTVTITESHLDVKARIPGGNKAAFDKATTDAKAGCPISRVLNTKITLAATLGD